MSSVVPKRLTINVVRAATASRRGFAQGLALCAMRLLEAITEFIWKRPRNFFYALFLETSSLNIGRGPRIRGRRSLHIGENFVALNFLWLEAVDYLQGYCPALIIGRRVTCGDSVHIASTNLVCIGDDVLMGSRITITDHNHGLYQGDGQSSPDQSPRDRVLSGTSQTFIEDNVWIGDGVIVLAGSVIGRGSVIGANSVVRGVIPPGSLVAGNPARVLRTFSNESKRWEVG